MKLSDLRKIANLGIKVPKKRVHKRSIKEVSVEVKIKPTSISKKELEKATATLSTAGKLNEEQYERFIQLMYDSSVIKTEKEKKNEK